MSDKAKCRDAHCPSKLMCERYTATDSVVWQPYVNFNREDDAYIAICSYTTVRVSTAVQKMATTR
jgi:hypothetical protein